MYANEACCCPSSTLHPTDTSPVQQIRNSSSWGGSSGLQRGGEGTVAFAAPARCSYRGVSCCTQPDIHVGVYVCMYISAYLWNVCELFNS